jgi:NAD+ diphosphatase
MNADARGTLPPTPTTPPSSDALVSLAFTGSSLVRRAVASIEELVHRTDALFLLICESRLVLKQTPAGLDALFSLAELNALSANTDAAVLLGFTREESPRFAAPLRTEIAALPAGFTAMTARELLTLTPPLPRELLAQFAQAASLLAWHERTRFCGCCGGPVKSQAGGSQRVCTACGHIAFPRTDPVAIMLVVDEARQRCLLGRTPHFPPGMYSALSGFVDAGESVEEAVRREVSEESGIRVGQIRYQASQPWPLPHSLMLGFVAEGLTTDIHRDPAELEDCRWFTRDEVAQMMTRLAQGPADAAAPLPPPAGTIAHRLMHDWISGRT